MYQMETFGVRRYQWSCTVRSLRLLLKVKTAEHWEVFGRVPVVCAKGAPGQNSFGVNKNGACERHTMAYSCTWESRKWMGSFLFKVPII